MELKPNSDKICIQMFNMQRTCHTYLLQLSEALCGISTIMLLVFVCGVELARDEDFSPDTELLLGPAGG